MCNITLAACCSCKLLEFCHKYVCAIQRHMAFEVMCAQLRFINSDTFCAMFCMTGISFSLHLVMEQVTWLSDAALCPLYDSMPACASQGLHPGDLFAASPFCIASPPLQIPLAYSALTSSGCWQLVLYTTRSCSNSFFCRFPSSCKQQYQHTMLSQAAAVHTQLQTK